PIASTDAVELGAKRLAVMLCEELAKFGQGARGFQLHAFRTDGSVSSIMIATAQAERKPDHIYRLLHERIDELDPGFGIDLLMLEAHRLGPMDMSAAALSGDLAATPTDIAAVSALVDRIRAKLGDDRVQVPTPVASHIPEHAETCPRFEEETFPTAQTRAPIHQSPRPIRIFDPPERITVLASVPDGPPIRFVWRRLTRKIVRADGPERIAPEWWQHQPQVPAPPAALTSCSPIQDDTVLVRTLPRARDYYRIEDEAGRRYWVFRKGLYDDDRGGAPDWYVQGQFA
ncbi:MAG: DNA polymerase Y family protein, partial [Hyphomonadaceae bacterium]